MASLALLASAPALDAEAKRGPAGKRLIEPARRQHDQSGDAPAQSRSSAGILSYGATLQSLIGADRSGKRTITLLGYDDLASYIDYPGHFGATIGRYADCTGGTRFPLNCCLVFGRLPHPPSPCPANLAAIG